MRAWLVTLKLRSTRNSATGPAVHMCSGQAGHAIGFAACLSPGRQPGCAARVTALALCCSDSQVPGLALMNANCYCYALGFFRGGCALPGCISYHDEHDAPHADLMVLAKHVRLATALAVLSPPHARLYKASGMPHEATARVKSVAQPPW